VVIMTDALIPVFSGAISNDTIQLCDARTLHAFMQVRRDFTTWIKARIQKYGFAAGEDYITIDSPKLGNQTGRGGDRRSTEYHLTLDMAKELAMVENNEQGRAARKYFIACERELLARTTRPVDPAIDYRRIDANQAQALKEAVQAIVATGAQGYGETWARLHRKFRVNSYLELPSTKFQEALAYLQAKAPNAVRVRQPDLIDPAELLLSGQADPAQLTPAQRAMIQHRAWELAGEACQLIHAHIERRVAFHLHQTQMDDEHIGAVVRGTTLGNALTHHYGKQLGTMASILKYMQATTHQTMERFNADMGRLAAAGVV
jgi:phage anti-repressor protein